MVLSQQFPFNSKDLFLQLACFRKLAIPHRFICRLPKPLKVFFKTRHCVLNTKPDLSG